MTSGILQLLRSRRFLPLFVTQFLGAFNDNFLKNAIAILIVFRLADQVSLSGDVIVTLGTALFVLPFFLFSATAGQIADRFDKARVIRFVKGVEIVLMGLAAAAFWVGEVWMLLGVLFLMGTQSSFFGPVKYAILPDHLDRTDLIGGNGLIEAGTFLAILAGTIGGGLLILGVRGTAIVSAGLIALATAGYAASRFIPRTVAAAPETRIDPNVFRQTGRILREARRDRVIFRSILGISWFWLVAAVLVTEMPPYARTVLGADETVVTLFLAVFSIGIGIGSLICGRLSRGQVEATYVPVGALGIAIFAADLWWASSGLAPVAGADLAGAGAFLAAPEHWRILADLLFLSVCGGVFVVPLYAIIQDRSDPARRSRMLAANNVMGAAFMTAGAGGAAGLLTIGGSVLDVFLIIAITSAGVAIYVCALLPDALPKAVLVQLLRLLYRFEVRGLENLTKAGTPAVIVANHVSFLDGVFLAAALPGRPVFAVNTHAAEKSKFKPFLKLIEYFPIDPRKPWGVKGLIRKVAEGRRCVIFPEGRLTRTGALMKFYEGPGIIAERTKAPIVPAYLEGAELTAFTYLRGKVRRIGRPKVRLTFGEPRQLDIGPDLKGRDRRAAAAGKLYDLVSEMSFRASLRRTTLFEALLDARAAHGGGTKILEDVERRPWSYDRLVAASFILRRWARAKTRDGENVGVLLPNSAGFAAMLFGLSAAGRRPALLNYSAGLASMTAAMEAASVSTVITSRVFVAAARMEKVVEGLNTTARIVYVEDIRRQAGLSGRILGAARSTAARMFGAGRQASPDDPAVILFTSGSEGKPKAVALSHRNVLANLRQLKARIDFNAADTVFNALPMFHAFGLTGGLIVPLLSGVPAFQYPSPLHHRIIPEMVYDTNATILFATDTFLARYGLAAHGYDFYSLRYVFAGAERLREETTALWSRKFGLRILEGYGVTEAAPVIALNTPMHNREGTAGRLLPGIEARVEPVDGIAEGGRLSVRGPNVMLGYMTPEGLVEPEGGWHDTGDLVTLDADGFLRITGRAKRFAKIAGEMVSLAAAEALSEEAWPAGEHAVVAIPDRRKGEKLVLATTQADVDVGELLHVARAGGVPEIMVPREIVCLDEMPRLATGKTDYPAVLAKLRAAGSAEEGGPPSSLNLAS